MGLFDFQALVFEMLQCFDALKLDVGDGALAEWLNIDCQSELLH
jgi:hypothetical protein